MLPISLSQNDGTRHRVKHMRDIYCLYSGALLARNDVWDKVVALPCFIAALERLSGIWVICRN